MRTKIPVSCYIIAQNESDRIAITIKSVINWVDEVIVVDGGSTDDTLKVSEAAGARAMFNSWPGYGYQKRFAEDQCRNHWLLNLDADEEITADLRDEIIALFANSEPEEGGFVLRIRDMLPGEKKLALLPHTDLRIRLYNMRKGRTEANPSFDPVIIERGEVRELKGTVLHRSFRSLSHMIAKINSYSDVQAKHLQTRGLKYPRLRLVIELPIAFLKAYLLRAYILRGWRGFIYAMIYAYGRFVRIAKYLERNGSF